MSTFFLTCALLGGVVLVAQFIMGLLGADHMDHGHAGHAHLGEGLDLFSVRALSAGLTFFGLVGLGQMSLGLNGVLALPLSVAAGAGAAFGVAYLVRSLLKLEQDHTASIAEAIGTSGTVYLAIPGARKGAGKVHVTVRNRIVECKAVTPDGDLPTGAAILVIDVSGDDTVVVVSQPSLTPAEEPSHAAS
jgi:membrane protein implicated in regulation of membrane protease activity